MTTYRVHLRAEVRASLDFGASNEESAKRAAVAMLKRDLRRLGVDADSIRVVSVEER